MCIFNRKIEEKLKIRIFVMTSLLMRTGSLPVQTRFIPSRKMTTTISRHNSVESLPSHGEDRFSAGKISIDGMQRVSSESDVIRSERMLKSVASKPSPEKIPEEDDEFRFSDGWGSLIWKESGTPAEEQGVSGGGGGSGYSGGKGEGGGGYEDRSKIGDYYREMLKSDPNNSLLLLNYGKFLYEVEKDAERAEEYYGRAILENPGDGEALSMYGKLIWETKRDEKRARGYFDQAVIASPDDWFGLQQSSWADDSNNLWARINTSPIKLLVPDQIRDIYIGEV